MFSNALPTLNIDKKYVMFYPSTVFGHEASSTNHFVRLTLCMYVRSPQNTINTLSAFRPTEHMFGLHFIITLPLE